MKIKPDIVTRFKSKFKRDISDPRQRDLIVEDALRQFEKKMETAGEKGSASREEAFALLDQLAFKYESKKLDSLDIYKKAYEKFPQEIGLLRAIVGLLRARDAKNKLAIHYYQKLSEYEPENFQILALLVDCYRENIEQVPLMLTYERIVKKYREMDNAQRWGTEPGPNWDFIKSQYKSTIHKLGEIYAEMGRNDEEALSIYREIIHADEPNVIAIKILAQSLVEKGRTDKEAMEVYELYLAFEPFDRNVRFLLTKAFLSSERIEEGLTILKNLCRENPDDAEALDFLIQYHVEHNIVNEESAPFFLTYLERHPEDKKILTVVAAHFAGQGSLSEQAVALYKRYVTLSSPHPSEKVVFYELLGRYYQNLQSWANVIEMYGKIRQIDPRSKEVIIPLATAFSEYDRIDDEALKIYKEAIDLGSRNERIHNLLCRYFFETNKHGPDSLKIFKDSLSIHPKNRYARLGICQHYLFICEYENSLAETLKHLRFYPGDEQAISCAADCLSHLDAKRMEKYLNEMDEKTRLQILEEAFVKNPGAKSVVLTLSDIYQKAFRRDDPAIRIYLAAFPHDRRNTALLTTLSNHFWRVGDEENAIHFDMEIFHLCRNNCPVSNSTMKNAAVPRDCPGACIRIARHILSTSKTMPETQEILRCAWRAGEKSPKLIRRLAAHFTEEEPRSTEALDIYQALIAVDPDADDARRKILRYQIDMGDPKPALLYCEERLKTNPDDKDTLDFLIQCLKNATITDERITNFLEKLLRKKPEDERLSLALAFLYSYQENFGIATLSVFLNALRLCPDDIQILVGIARCYEDSGNLARAAETYERILESIPDDVTIICRLAHTYMKMGVKNERALDIITKGVEFDPFDRDMHFYLADHCLTTGDNLRSIAILERFLKNNPAAIDEVVSHLENLRQTVTWSPELHIKMGFLYIEKDNQDNALNEFSQISQNYTRYCGDLIEGYNRILQKHPHHVRALVERGVLFKIIGDFEESVADLENARNIDAENPNILYELAECYEAYSSLMHEPQLEMLYKLGGLYLDLEEYDKAIKTYQQILNRERESREAILSIGKAFSCKGELDLAYQYYRRLETTDEVKNLLYALGNRYYAAGNLEKALDVFNYILSVDIVYRDVNNLVNILREEMKGEHVIAKRHHKEIMQQLSMRARQRFDIIEEVGRGIIGVVYKAYDRELDAVVALKILSERFSEDEKALERFSLEVKSARRISHPNIVRIYDIGEENGRKYISMEYVDGGDLKQLLLVQKRLQPKLVIEFTLQIASALAAAHALNIIHRDIKPANILLTQDKVCKLTDFGIAAFFEESRDLSSNIIVGNPIYMSPEQNEGKNLTSSSDIYSLGIVMYEMLSGAPPFRTGNIPYHHIFTAPPEMKDVDSKLSAIVMKCLEKKPNNRFGRMVDLIAALESCRTK